MRPRPRPRPRRVASGEQRKQCLGTRGRRRARGNRGLWGAAVELLSCPLALSTRNGADRSICGQQPRGQGYAGGQRSPFRGSMGLFATSHWARTCMKDYCQGRYLGRFRSACSSLVGTIRPHSTTPCPPPAPDCHVALHQAVWAPGARDKLTEAPSTVRG